MFAILPQVKNKETVPNPTENIWNPRFSWIWPSLTCWFKTFGGPTGPWQLDLPFWARPLPSTSAQTWFGPDLDPKRAISGPNQLCTEVFGGGRGERLRWPCRSARKSWMLVYLGHFTGNTQIFYASWGPKVGHLLRAPCEPRQLKSSAAGLVPFIVRWILFCYSPSAFFFSALSLSILFFFSLFSFFFSVCVCVSQCVSRVCVCVCVCLVRVCVCVCVCVCVSLSLSLSICLFGPPKTTKTPKKAKKATPYKKHRWKWKRQHAYLYIYIYAYIYML